MVGVDSEEADLVEETRVHSSDAPEMLSMKRTTSGVMTNVLMVAETSMYLQKCLPSLPAASIHMFSLAFLVSGSLHTSHCASHLILSLCISIFRTPDSVGQAIAASL
jgi:hypothetical protein